jgi:hypothetical protein
MTPTSSRVDDMRQKAGDIKAGDDTDHNLAAFAKEMVGGNS